MYYEQLKGTFWTGAQVKALSLFWLGAQLNTSVSSGVLDKKGMGDFPCISIIKRYLVFNAHSKHIFLFDFKKYIVALQLCCSSGFCILSN